MKKKNTIVRFLELAGIWNLNIKNELIHIKQKKWREIGVHILAQERKKIFCL